MKATSLLEKQHRKVEAIFKKLTTGRSDAAPLLRELANNLAAHMAIEQEIFYPAVRRVDESLILESYEEHALAELALKRLMSTDTGNESFKARVIALKELIEHHVKEEEDDLFPKVEKAVSPEKLDELGARMKARFNEILEKGFEAATPKGYGRTSADISRKHARAAAVH